MNKLFFLIFSLSISILSCSPEPTPTNRKVTRYTGPVTQSSLVAPGGEVYCTAWGEDCHLWLLPGQQPIYYRQEIYSNFIEDYYRGDLQHFFDNNEWQYLFPSGTSFDQENIDKIITGQYPIRIMSDSSIVVFDNENYLDQDNILFAIKRVYQE